MSDARANPAPLGLMGFGMTTVLLNIHNAGLFGGGESMGIILAMGIFYGGLAQIFAGIMEFRKGNTFGTTAFTSYGLFWISLVCIVLFGGEWGTSPGFMGWYLFLWGLFTFFMWIATWKANRALQVVFLSLTILFWMLAARDAFGWFGTWAAITGYEGIFCGASAIYLAMAEVINEKFERTVLPIG